MKFVICILVILGCASAQLKNTTVEAILKAHNDFRSSIARGNYSARGVILPAASNMRKMKWDQQLATTIQDFLNKCQVTQFEDSRYGQNFHFGTHALITAAAQMAWAETEFIGCGAKTCDSPMLPGMGVYEFRVVCLYRETGNILNSNIYKQGKACSACPSGYKCEGNSGLCVRI